MNDKHILFIDTHAHYYPFSSFAQFFEAAYDNMSRVAEAYRGYQSTSFVLCLSETANGDWYQTIAMSDVNSVRDPSFGNWSVDNQSSESTLRVFTDDGKEIYLLPGRQVVTEEKIEILIIGCADVIPFNQPAEQYLAEYSEKYLLIFPWGVGKWLGKRGQVVNQLLEMFPRYRFALGDNSGRPNFWRNIPQFKLATARGIKILPGSDPLPVKRQHRKIGSYGSVLVRKIEKIDARYIAEALMASDCFVANYGSLDGILNFLYSQIRVRLQPYRSD